MADMTAEEKLREDEEAILTDDQRLSRTIHRAFSTKDGRIALIWILNECGYFATDAGEIDSSLVAFAARLLEAGGMRRHLNVETFANALLSSYSE